MTRDILAHVLEAEGIKAGAKGGYVIAEEREATCLISAPGDILQVTRVILVDLREKYVHLQTGKNERMAFAYDDVLGLRMLGPPAASRAGVAGFSR